MEKIVKFYTDAELTEEVVDMTLKLGVLPAGKVQEYKFWVLNDSKGQLTNLEFIVDHPEVKLIDSPKELLPHANSEFVVEWSPSVDLEEGLNINLRIKGIRLLG